MRNLRERTARPRSSQPPRSRRVGGGLTYEGGGLDRVIVDRIFELEGDGKTAAEIAGALNISKMAVQQRITRARRAKKERDMANIGDVNRMRIEDLNRRGKSIEEIANLTGLSKGAVISHLSINGGDGKPKPPPSTHVEAAKKSGPAEEGKAFKEWEQDDYERFVSAWQEAPSFTKAATDEGLSEDEIRFIVKKLKQKGVPLKRPTKWSADFEKLKALAMSKLNEAEKARMEKWRERGLKNVEAMQKARKKQLAAK